MLPRKYYRNMPEGPNDSIGPFSPLNQMTFQAVLGPSPITPAHPQVSVYISIDTSGSMRGEKIDQVCKSLRQIITKAPNFVRFVVRSFNHEINTIVSKKKKYLDVERLVEALEEKIGGGTALFDAWGQTIEQIPYNASKLDLAHIIIFTDGENNCSKVFSLDSVMKITNEKLEGKFHFTFIQAGKDSTEVVNHVKLYGKKGHCESFNVENSSRGIKFAFERVQQKLNVAFEMKLITDGIGGITAQLGACNLVPAGGRGRNPNVPSVSIVVPPPPQIYENFNTENAGSMYRVSTSVSPPIVKGKRGNMNRSPVQGTPVKSNTDTKGKNERGNTERGRGQYRLGRGAWWRGPSEAN